MARRKLPTGIRETKSGYELRFSMDGQQYSVSAATIDECKNKELGRRQQIIERRYIRNANITLERYFDEWIDSRRGTVKEATLYVNRQRFEHIRPYLGKMKIVDIERRQVIEMQKELNKKLTTTGANSSVTLLSTILKAANADRIIQWNPCEGVKHLQRTEKDATETIHRALTIEETELFFKYAKDSWYQYYYKFLLLTGMRNGEGCALTWSDIDRINSVIHISKTMTRISDSDFTIGTPKTKKSVRDIPLTNQMIQVLNDQKEMQLAVNGGKAVSMSSRVFTSMNGGYITAAANCSTIKSILNRAAADGHIIEKFSTHCFRDTFATRAIEQGMNPQTLKTILGHSSLAMTMDKYAHVLPNTKQEEMNKICISF